MEIKKSAREVAYQYGYDDALVKAGEENATTYEEFFNLLMKKDEKLADSTDILLYELAQEYNAEDEISYIEADYRSGWNKSIMDIGDFYRSEFL